jgi:hypothetical protein
MLVIFAMSCILNEMSSVTLLLVKKFAMVNLHLALEFALQHIVLFMVMVLILMEKVGIMVLTQD